MPYVMRDLSGAVCGVFTVEQVHASEFLPDNHADVLAYLNPPPPVPAEISPSQLFRALLAYGFITEQEAIDAATTGAMPADVQAAIAQLPSDQQVNARIIWARMTTVQRADPMVALLAAAQDPPLTEEQVDDFFRAAAVL